MPHLQPKVCFEVEEIIGVAGVGNVKNYCVRWAPTWISGINLVGCDDLIEQFLQQQKEQELQVETQQNQHQQQNQLLQQPRLPSRKKCKLEDGLTTSIQQDQEDAPSTDNSIEGPGLDHSDGTITVLPGDEYECTVKIEISDHEDGGNASVVQNNNNNNNSYNNNNNNSSNNNITDVKHEEERDSIAEHMSYDDTIADGLSPCTNEHTDRLAQRYISQPRVDMQSNEQQPMVLNSRATTSSFTTNSQYTCNTCRLTFPSWDHLYSHAEIHSDYSCAVCHKKFSQYSSLLDHQEQHRSNFTPEDFLTQSHSMERPYLCVHCHQSFRKSYSLKMHVQKNHGIDVDL